MHVHQQKGQSEWKRESERLHAEPRARCGAQSHDPDHDPSPNQERDIQSAVPSKCPLIFLSQDLLVVSSLSLISTSALILPPSVFNSAHITNLKKKKSFLEFTFSYLFAFFLLFPSYLRFLKEMYILCLFPQVPLTLQPTTIRLWTPSLY